MPLSGKGKLTEKVINSMQNYYGLAIRENKNDLYGMKKAVWAILWHCTAFEDEEYRHRFCPRENTSWCKYHKNKELNIPPKKCSVNISQEICNIIKPIFTDLSSEDLLKKCLHGETQNANESLNNVIWNKCPKSVYVGRPVLEMGVHSAVLEFNEGSCGIDSVFKHFGIQTGSCTHNLSVDRNQDRICRAMRKSAGEGRKRRKTLRAIKKGLIDKDKELEPKDSYITGGY